MNHSTAVNHRSVSSGRPVSSFAHVASIMGPAICAGQLMDKIAGLKYRTVCRLFGLGRFAHQPETRDLRACRVPFSLRRAATIRSAPVPRSEVSVEKESVCSGLRFITSSSPAETAAAAPRKTGFVVCEVFLSFGDYEQLKISGRTAAAWANGRHAFIVHCTSLFFAPAGLSIDLTSSRRCVYCLYDDLPRSTHRQAKVS